MIGMPCIALLPVGNPDRRAFDNLAWDLKGMGFDVERAGWRVLPRGAFDARRGQFRADALLRVALSVRAERVLAVTDVDLYADDLNFVFGIAQPSGKACVISLLRLYFDADEDRFRGRALKEAMHELGHCADPGCVMWFSNTLEETDRKSGRLLPPVQGGAALSAPSRLRSLNSAPRKYGSRCRFEPGEGSAGTIE
jgi:archaemetzincin